MSNEINASPYLPGDFSGARVPNTDLGLSRIGIVRGPQDGSLQAALQIISQQQQATNSIIGTLLTVVSGLISRLFGGSLQAYGNQGSGLGLQEGTVTRGGGASEQGGYLNRIGGVIGDFFKDGGLSKIGDFFGSIFGGVKDGIGSAVSSVGNFGKSIFSGLSSIGSSVFSGIGSLAKGIGSFFGF